LKERTSVYCSPRGYVTSLTIMLIHFVMTISTTMMSGKNYVANIIMEGKTCELKSKGIVHCLSKMELYDCCLWKGYVGRNTINTLIYFVNIIIIMAVIAIKENIIKVLMNEGVIYAKRINSKIFKTNLKPRKVEDRQSKYSKLSKIRELMENRSSEPPNNSQNQNKIFLISSRIIGTISDKDINNNILVKRHWPT